MTPPAKSQLKAAIYARISSDRDETRLGVDRQLKDCRKLCAERGWTVVDEYVDNDISAADPKKVRPEYNRMLQDIKNGRVSAVAVWDIDRLHRRPAELEAFVTACEVAGLNTLGSVGGDTDLNDEGALFMLRTRVNVAAYEIAKTRKRIKRKHLELAEAGKNSGGGTRPFGFEDDRVTVRESEAALIREAARRILTGGTLYGICKDWNDRGLRSVTGKQWHIQSVKTSLTRPRVAGLRQHQGEVIGEAVWDSILDRDTWKQVCAILKDPSRRQPPPSRDYPLRGVLKCAECGRELTAMPAANRRGYGCRKTSGGCGHVFINADMVEKYIFGIVLPLADSPTARQIMRDAEGVEITEAKEMVEANTADEATIRELANDYYSRKVIDRATFLRETKAAQERLDARHVQLTALAGRSALDRLSGNVSAQWDELSADDRRAIVQSFIPVVKVRPKKVRGGNRFDPNRVSIAWRFGQLAAASVGLWDAMTDEVKQAAWERDQATLTDAERYGAA